MEVRELSKSNFTLPKEIVIVKFIKRKRGMASHVDENHVISGGMLSGSKKKFCAPLTRSNTIVNVLNDDEKTYLENATGINLSVYGEFWKTFYVSLWKDDANNRFDLSDPMDYLSIKLLEKLKDDVALSWNDRNKKQSYQFVITRVDEEFKETKAKLDTKKQAFKFYGKIEHDKEKLIGILKLLTNQPFSDDSTLEWIQGKVEMYLDTMPSAFLAIIEDPSFDTKVLINKGVDNGSVIKNSNKYTTVDGLDLCENGSTPSFDNAVKYLDDVKNQEVRHFIEARINNSK
jgi:hypothetical protein